MDEEKYYVIYNGIGSTVLIAKEDKEFIESVYNKNDGEVFLPFNEETKKMLIEKKILLADTLYKTDPIVYKKLEEEQRIIDEFNSLPR